MKYLGNNFSLNMLGFGMKSFVVIEGLETKPPIEGYVSLLTDESIAMTLEVSCNNNPTQLLPGDELIIAQRMQPLIEENLSPAVLAEHELQWYKVIIK
jgi:hypothetical protein